MRIYILLLLYIFVNSCTPIVVELRTPDLVEMQEHVEEEVAEVLATVEVEEGALIAGPGEVVILTGAGSEVFRQTYTDKASYNRATQAARLDVENSNTFHGTDLVLYIGGWLF